MKKTVLVIALFSAVIPTSAAVFGQMWAVRDVTRAFYGRSSDDAVPADYDGDGVTDLAVFRSYYNLWAVKDFTRHYFGSGTDEPVPADYNGDLVDDIAVFRGVYGLWAIKGVTRIFHGTGGDFPVSPLGSGDYDGDGTSDIGIFRAVSGLWSIKAVTRVFFGAGGDVPVSCDYNGDGSNDIGIFRGSSGLWAIRLHTRAFFGSAVDVPVPGDYDGDGTSDIGIFRATSGLWVIKDVTRTFFGRSGDGVVPGDYEGDSAFDVGVFRPIPTPTPETIAQIQKGFLTGTQTVTGIVNLVYPDMEFFIAEAPGAYHGICVSQTTYGPDIGDLVTITGTVSSSNGKTVITSLTAYSVDSSDNEPYAPVTITTAQVTDEQYEGCLVRVEDVEVSNEHTGSGKWQVQPQGGGNAVTIDDELDYNYFPLAGDQFSSIIGIVERNTSSSPNQWLQPRFTADLAAAGNIIPHYALHGTVVTMDDSHTVYDSYYIEVQGDLIEGVTASAPAGVDIIDVNGLIFPALINSHDHPSKGIWDLIPFPNLGSYKCLNDWGGSDADPATKQMYNDFLYQSEGEMFSTLNDTYPIGKLTEVRMASSGCTVTQGQVKSSSHYRDEVAKLGVGIINGERFPGRCNNVVFAAAESSAYWVDQHHQAENGKIHRYIIHLAQSLPESEGGCEAWEWPWWAEQSSFDGNDVIIHGNSLRGDDFAEWSHPNGKQSILSWVCYCNMVYYGSTADIPAALAHDAIVCIGTDATPWGMPNMLAELNYCKYYSDQSGWSIQTRQFIDMVIRNGAIAFGQLDRMGTIEEGKLASFMVIDDGPGDPYDDLLMVAGAGEAYDYRCGPKDVRLTICAGRPIYGDASLLNTANFPFLYAPYIEDLTICGESKKLTIARHNNAGIDGVDDLFWDFYSDLWERYCRSGQYPSAFVSVDPAGIVPPTPVPTPTPLPGTYIITAGSDDAHDHDTYFNNSDDYIYIGWRGGSGNSYRSGFRFTNVDVPQGATVTSAVLQVTHYSENDNASLHIVADDVDDSATFAADAGPKDRTFTTAEVAWSLSGSWTPGQEYPSPDISSVVQEVVNRPGWSSGNNLSIIIYADSNPTENFRRRVYSYNGDRTKTARLEIDVAPTPTPY